MPLTSHAAEADLPVKDKSWTFTFRFENDLFANTDRNYTNGIKVSWISPDLTRFRDSEQLPAWAKQLVAKLPFSRVPDLQRNISFSIGQNIYTPDDIAARNLITDDRPYAGWLYGSVAFHNKDYRHLDTIEIQAGIVGPWSLAEQAQNFVHHVRGIPEANGWDNQIKNEPGLNLIYEHKDRILRPPATQGFGYDLITHYGGAVGNIFTYANIGAEARIGWNIPTDFGTSLIRPGGDTNAPSDTKDPRYLRSKHGFSVHAFGAITGRAVLRDIFLDGNSFRDSYSVDKNNFVGDVILGVSVIYGRLKLSYAQVLRSKEFKLQKTGHDFGSVTLSYTY